MKTSETEMVSKFVSRAINGPSYRIETSIQGSPHVMYNKGVLDCYDEKNRPLHKHKLAEFVFWIFMIESKGFILVSDPVGCDGGKKSK